MPCCLGRFHLYSITSTAVRGNERDPLVLHVALSLSNSQGIFYNIKNFLTFQLSTAVAALSIVAVATFLGFKCPINAMQVRSKTCFIFRFRVHGGLVGF